MPQAEVVFYQKADGSVPVLDWLDGQTQKVVDKCAGYIQRLEAEGGSLQRPSAATLRNKIRELRPSRQGIHYRILYFMYGNTGVLAHGCIKVKEVPDKDIAIAVERRRLYFKNPPAHTYVEDEDVED